MLITLITYCKKPHKFHDFHKKPHKFHDFHSKPTNLPQFKTKKLRCRAIKASIKKKLEVG